MSDRGIVPFNKAWAEDAVDGVPPVPVKGTSYRKSSATDTEVGKGNPYGSIAESALINEEAYRNSALIQELNKKGTLGYSSEVDYLVADGAIVMDDGRPYFLIQDNGPSSTVKQPSSEPLFWLDMSIFSRQVEPLTTPNGRFRSGMVLAPGVALPSGDTYSADERFLWDVFSGSGVNFAQGVTVTDSGIVHTAGNIYLSEALGAGTEITTVDQLTLHIVDNLDNKYWFKNGDTGVIISINAGIAKFEWTSDIYAALAGSSIKQAFGQKEVGVVGELSEECVINSLRTELVLNRTWQNVLSSRSSGVPYTNELQFPINLSIHSYTIGTIQLEVDGDVIFDVSSGGGGFDPLFQYTIESGETYKITVSGGATLARWWEKR